MMAPRVSVVIPVHNGAPYAVRCIACLRAQTIQDVEFIFVDDASTDTTVETLKREIAGDARFSVLRQIAKAGPLSARMRGAAAATAPVLMFMDFDDELMPDACRKVAETMAREKVDVFCYAMEAVGADGCDRDALERCRSYLGRRSPCQGRVAGKGACFDLFFSNAGVTASACDKAVRSSVLKRIYGMIGSGDGLLCAQDFLQTTLLFLHAESVYVDQSQVLYRYHFGNGMSGHASGNVTWEQLTRRATAIDSYRRLCSVLAAETDLAPALRERIEGRFLWGIRGTALPEVWKLPEDLVPAGIGFFLSRWGDDVGSPSIFDAGRRSGRSRWVKRVCVALSRRMAMLLRKIGIRGGGR